MKRKFYMSAILGTFLLVGCTSQVNSAPRDGFEVKFLVGSALQQFCNQAAEQFNQTKPKLSDGKTFYLSCQAMGSGDVVTTLVNQAKQLQSGSLQADSPEFPTLVSLDGEIYQFQLIYLFNQVFPGQNYIPQITDAP
ncbi:hypothetical protein [Scytonema sp. UIC 10036]|uniref:hypothetical protein n=1 Tax=Scytonema sp. UIC 10036 TaxID=2304196 RepID=UPI001FAAFCD7|nr:hypothetical protein [Scytonema sp. UIC 10036]